MIAFTKSAFANLNFKHILKDHTETALAEKGWVKRSWDMSGPTGQGQHYGKWYYNAQTGETAHIKKIHPEGAFNELLASSFAEKLQVLCPQIDIILGYDEYGVKGHLCVSPVIGKRAQTLGNFLSNSLQLGRKKIMSQISLGISAQIPFWAFIGRGDPNLGNNIVSQFPDSAESFAYGIDYERLSFRHLDISGVFLTSSSHRAKRDNLNKLGFCVEEEIVSDATENLSALSDDQIKEVVENTVGQCRLPSARRPLVEEDIDFLKTRRDFVVAHIHKVEVMAALLGVDQLEYESMSRGAERPTNKGAGLVVEQVANPQMVV